MKQILIRSAIAGLGAGVLVSFGVAWRLLSGTAEVPVVFHLIIAVFVGGVAAFVVAGLVFLFQRFPRNAKVALLFGTGACVLVSVGFFYTATHEGKPHDIGLHIFAWCLVWPLAFVTSLWVDVKRSIANKLVDGIKTSHSDRGAGGPTSG